MTSTRSRISEVYPLTDIGHTNNWKFIVKLAYNINPDRKLIEFQLPQDKTMQKTVYSNQFLERRAQQD